MNDRLSKMLLVLKACHADAALISSPTTIAYLTGFKGLTLMEREGYLLISKKQNILILNSLRFHEAQGNNKNISLIEMNREQTFERLFEDFVKKNDISTLCIEELSLNVSEYKAIEEKVKSIKNLPIRTLRITKTPEEISCIKKACDIANKAFTTIKPLIKPGMAEKDLAFALEIEIRKQKAEIAFPSIIAFGQNAAVPHHVPDSTKLKSNDLVLMDFGAMYKGYCSDMTRTIFIGKPPAGEQKKVYEIVRASQQKAVEYLNQELRIKNQAIKASDVDKVAREYIISQDYPSIPHSLGHGIGLEVHEAPSLSPRSRDLITEGMVFSIEPGIYLQESFGVRIEDLFTIMNNKLIRLTGTPPHSKSNT